MHNQGLTHDVKVSDEVYARFENFDMSASFVSFISGNTKAMSYAEDLARVQKDGYALEFIQDQTLEICLAAIQKKPIALKYVKEQTPELCLAAVQQFGWTLKFVKDLHSIADKIDESVITEGLDYRDEEVVLAYQKLVKIREANAIARNVNNTVRDTKFKNRKAKL